MNEVMKNIKFYAEVPPSIAVKGGGGYPIATHCT